MNKDKEKTLEYFIETIKLSWTYEKLTKEEQKRLLKVFNSVQTKNCLKGNFQKRWEILQAIYHSFLMALDYSPFNWREEQDIPKF